ncbi:diguanylate cyclase [Fictibacillus aquaticus]|uniref:GGDEF domain-containing protein n=1 Tax=Fictibacillus aquaticus TaxID=2021314 RepID=A0A235F6I4_9BACL|nr:diguanylate cyclase [Fictibacillus aquaticus]OYD56557.1 hypothetical protein CGZ90_16220 [Fictibacillus aquaticus]
MIKDLIFHSTLILSYLFIVGFVISWEQKSFYTPLFHNVFLGIATGLMGIVLMYFSVRISSDIFIDMRHLFMIIAALFGGPIAAILSGAIIGTGRTLMHGLSESSVSLGILMAGIGCMAAVISRTKWGVYTKGFIMNLISLAVIFAAFTYLLDFPAAIENFAYLSLFSIPLGFLAVSLNLYLYRSNEMIRKMKQEVRLDYLTGLNNVRTFDEELNHYKNERGIRGELLSILFMDIDFFKKVNDTHGHDAGDEVLKQLAQVLKDNSRSFDIVSRNGGEEFSVLLPDCQNARAIEIAERIRQAVESHPFTLPSGKLLHITISIGVASFPETVGLVDELVKQADDALYSAKKSGRNKVVSGPLKTSSAKINT